VDGDREKGSNTKKKVQKCDGNESEEMNSRDLVIWKTSGDNGKPEKKGKKRKQKDSFSKTIYGRRGGEGNREVGKTLPRAGSRTKGLNRRGRDKKGELQKKVGCAKGEGVLQIFQKGETNAGGKSGDENHPIQNGLSKKKKRNREIGSKTT